MRKTWAFIWNQEKYYLRLSPGDENAMPNFKWKMKDIMCVLLCFLIFGSFMEGKEGARVLGKGLSVNFPLPFLLVMLFYWLRWNCTLQVRAQDKPELHVRVLIYQKISWQGWNTKSVGRTRGHGLICLGLWFWKVVYRPELCNLYFSYGQLHLKWPSCPVFIFQPLDLFTT